MKLFENTGHSGNQNWVDKNNVAAGFNMGASCCENFGFEYAKSPGGTTLGEIDIEGYSFDPNYFEENIPKVESLGYGFDGGGAVAFKMVNDADPNDIVYLTFYNAHNGYYGHGFDFKIGDKTVHEGYL